jgi:hypothetical protein
MLQRNTFRSRGAGARGEHREEPRVGAPELLEPRLPHVPELLGELPREALLGEEAAVVDGEVFEAHRPVGPHHAVEGEDVGHRHLGLHPDEDVVAHDEPLPDGDDVAREAVVLGAEAVGGDEGELGAAEHLLAPRVELVGAAPELLGLLDEPAADDLVAAAELVGGGRGAGGVGHRVTGGRVGVGDASSSFSGSSAAGCGVVICASSVRSVSLWSSAPSTDWPTVTARMKRSKNCPSPPTMLIFACSKAARSTSACTPATSLRARICSSAITFCCSSVRRNSSCWRLAASSAFIASAFSERPVASALIFARMVVASARPYCSDGARLGLAHLGLREPWLSRPCASAGHLLLRDARLDEALLLVRATRGLADAHVGHPLRGGLGLLALGEAHLGARLLVRGLQIGVGGDDLLAGLVLRHLLGGLGGLHLLDERLLTASASAPMRFDLARAVGLGEGAHVLDALLLLGDRLVDGDAGAHHVGDLLALPLDLGLAGDLLGDLALAVGGLELAGPLDALALDGDLALACSSGDGTARSRTFSAATMVSSSFFSWEEGGALLLLVGDAAASFCSRAWATAISLFFLASASARAARSGRRPRRRSRFWLPVSMRSFCRSSLVLTFCTTVSSVIFRMPSASMMLSGSSDSRGVCSR